MGALIAYALLILKVGSMALAVSDESFLMLRDDPYLQPIHFKQLNAFNFVYLSRPTPDNLILSDGVSSIKLRLDVSAGLLELRVVFIMGKNEKLDSESIV